MSFVFPGFLLALLAIAIPIIVHLFHFRRFKRVFFSNVAFLQQLSDESKKQSRLRQLLILISRVMAISFLVMAFARPFIPAAETNISMRQNAVSVYIDNSFSMDALAQKGRLLDEAKEAARKIVDNYLTTDQFQLLTNDFEGRHQRFVGRDEFLAMLDDVRITSTFRTIGEVLNRQTSLLIESPVEARHAYLISDFQKSSTLTDEIQSDTLAAVTFLPVEAQGAGNIYIDSCWFESPIHIPGQAEVLTVRVTNDSDRALSGQPVRLFIDGIQRTIASYDAAPRSSTDVDLSWIVNEPGLRQGIIEIVDYPVTFDDQLYFSYLVEEEIALLSINDGRPGPFLDALFGKESIFRYEQMPVFSIDYSRFAEFNLIILNGLNSISAGLSAELGNFIEYGGNLLIFPGTSIDFTSYAEFFASIGADSYSRLDTISTRVGMLNDRHRLFTGVFENIPDNIDLPLVNQHYVISRRLTSVGQDLMQLQGGASFFSSRIIGNGNLFLSAVPLNDDFSNFQRHALFVPTLVNVALQSGFDNPLYHIPGRGEPVTLRGVQGAGDDLIILRGIDLEVIPEQRKSGTVYYLYFHEQISNAGNYTLYAGNTPVNAVSFNYDRRESKLATYSVGELASALSDQGLENIQLLAAGGVDFEQSLKEIRMGTHLWRHFLVIALLFLLAEVMLIRLWR